MTRAKALLALLGVLAMPSKAFSGGYKTIPYTPVDAIPYFKPGPELARNLHQIDPLIREAVVRINTSGWVWTAESCQGRHWWSPDPMLRLVTREEDVGRLLTAVYRAARVGDPDAATTELNNSTVLRIVRHAPAPSGWTEFRVFAHGVRRSQREGLRYFDRLANRLQRTP